VTNPGKTVGADSLVLLKPADATIIHIPHASRVIPDDVRKFICLDDAALETELDMLTDHYTDELFSIDHDSISVLQYPVSRYVADPERFSDDSMELMSEHGQGAVYVQTVDGKKLRDGEDHKHREHLLNQYYWPHHNRLEELTERALLKHGRALIIDAHSFPVRPLKVDLDQSLKRPDICIGTDAGHTPGVLVQLLMEYFSAAGLSVSINQPYAGTIVPMRYFNKEFRVRSVMIEVNRQLYLQDEPRDIRKKEPGFTQLQILLEKTILKAAAFNSVA